MAKKLKKNKKRKATQSQKNLAEIREKFRESESLARARFRDLERYKLSDWSAAYSYAVDTKSKAKSKENARMFDLDAQKTFRDLRREVTRIQNFLNFSDNSLEGARFSRTLLRNEMTWGEHFGRQWYDEYGVNYNQGVISESQAKTAFAIYRRLEEDRDFWLEVHENERAFGSDNLIFAIIDMVVKRRVYTYNEDDQKIKKIKKDAEDLLKRNAAIREREAKLETTKGNVDSKLLLSSKNAVDFISKMNF